MNYSLIILPTSLYVATSIKCFHPIWPKLVAINQWTLRLQIFLNRSRIAFNACAHYLMPMPGLPSFLLVPRNTATIQSMLGTFSTDDGLVSQFAHWFTLWVEHTSPRKFTQDGSPPHSIQISTFLTFNPISYKAYYTGTPATGITATNISVSQAPCKINVLPYLVVPPINITGDIFTTGTSFSASILYFWIGPLEDGPLLHLPILSVLPSTLCLIHYPHHFPYPIMCLCCIVIAYCTPTLSFLSGSILLIGTVEIFLPTCVPCELHWRLIQIFFAVHCNLIAQLNFLSTSNF